MKRIENKKKYFFQLRIPEGCGALTVGSGALIGGSGALTGSVGGGDVGVSEQIWRSVFLKKYSFL
jgi:hypothetical protein